MLTKPEKLPDLLRDRAATYFERDGLCFAPAIETTRLGACELALYFQNRYEGRVVARVQVLPPLRPWRLKRHDLPVRTFAIQCPGGGFGVARAAFPVPHAYQGRRMTFELGAGVKYPDGRGELLRFRGGVRAGSTCDTSAGGQLLAAVLALPLGLLGSSTAATATLTLPQGLSSNADDGGEFSEIIWWPELLEDVAPPLPRQAAA